MKKEYKFKGKTYIVKKESCGCVGCAFDSENANTCQSFLCTKDVPHCSLKNVIFIEKLQTAVTKEDKKQRGTIPSKRFEQEDIVPMKETPKLIIRAVILPTIERFIVCLSENGKLAPAESPKQHNSRENAEKEAERLCKLYHQEFVVLQVVSAVKPQNPKKEIFA